MRDLTGKNIEKHAVMELITYCETMIDRIILQSAEEMVQLNKQKAIQGIYQKNRIDVEAIRRAIKTINKSEYPLLSETTGGILSKSEKELEKQSKKENILTEVA